MPPGLVLFAGAPEASSLNWAEPGLLNTFNEPVARFAGLVSRSERDGIPVSPNLTSASTTIPPWRSLPLDRQHLATGLTQSFNQPRPFPGESHPQGWPKDCQGASFFTASEMDSFMEEMSQPPEGENHRSSMESVEQVLSQFYEESYAKHKDIPSSQIAAVSDTEASFTSGGTSFESASFDSQLRPAGQVPVTGQLTNLKDIPNAKYINSTHPQTMTVNLIVGIISIPQPRPIKTRRGADVELIEVLVGDETKSGFGVNFWLSSSQSVAGDMRTVLGGLRPQDVVLMRNVALSSFKAKVYGQSLRKEMTKVHLLYRNRVDRSDIRGYYRASDLVQGSQQLHPQLEKTIKVREWVMKFVGVGAGQKKGEALEAVKEVLPPDTQ
jgi:hypothetical protein